MRGNRKANARKRDGSPFTPAHEGGGKGTQKETDAGQRTIRSTENVRLTIAFQTLRRQGRGEISKGKTKKEAEEGGIKILQKREHRSNIGRNRVEQQTFTGGGRGGKHGPRGGGGGGEKGWDIRRRCDRLRCLSTALEKKKKGVSNGKVKKKNLCTCNAGAVSMEKN